MQKTKHIFIDHRIVIFDLGGLFTQHGYPPTFPHRSLPSQVALKDVAKTCKQAKTRPKFTPLLECKFHVSCSNIVLTVFTHHNLTRSTRTSKDVGTLQYVKICENSQTSALLDCAWSIGYRKILLCASAIAFQLVQDI